MNISYKATFIKQYNKLDKDLQEEILEKIELFKNKDNHKSLRIHKLHGKLKENYSFYINYKIRVVFVWESKKEAIFLVVGDHDIYK